MILRSVFHLQYNNFPTSHMTVPY